MSLMERARRIIAGARPYRFDGEQQNHADQLRQTQTSLSMMTNADPNDPDQVRMATEIEEDQENQLAELLKKPRLTLEQKRTRDAIQTALQQRRAGFGDAPVLVPREAKWAPARFLGPLAMVQPWMIGAGAAVLIFVLWQADAAWLRFSRDRACERGEVQAGSDTHRKPCIELGETQRQLEHSHAALREATRMVREADTNAQQTAETLRALERQRQLRAAQQRRTQRELEALRNGLGEPPELGLREPDPAATGNSSDGGSGNPNPR